MYNVKKVYVLFEKIYAMHRLYSLIYLHIIFCISIYNLSINFFILISTDNQISIYLSIYLSISLSIYLLTEHLHDSQEHAVQLEHPQLQSERAAVGIILIFNIFKLQI